MQGYVNSVGYAFKLYSTYGSIDAYFRSEYKHQDECVCQLAAGEGGKESLIWMERVPVEGSDYVEHTADYSFHCHSTAQEPVSYTCVDSELCHVARPSST